jgi:FAD/FMN-containing dehydrogenase
MGGQQFGNGTTLVDTRALDRVLAFDAERGLLTVEAGIQWPALFQYLDRSQQGAARQWGIYQKQTGADRLTIGGALSCNAHGRGLTLKPIVQQIESFEIVTAQGELVSCSRDRRPNLFRLAVGGYGLFGILASVTLRLRPRVKVRRLVTLATTEALMDAFDWRIRDGSLYGDFQFAIDPAGSGFLRDGVLSCYQEVDAQTPVTANPVSFSDAEWAALIADAHGHKQRAFARYAARYLQTDGQVYWSDAQLAGSYFDHYHADLDRATGAAVKGTEMITELYVPRPRFEAFMEEARTELRQRRANVIYGTVRLIERDDETVLAWARDRFACIVLNLHVDHTRRAIEAATAAFQALIDVAISHCGSYYLTYHRWARRDQVERCYPQMRAFLAAKRAYDPGDLFQSDWYRHHAALLA